MDRVNGRAAANGIRNENDLDMGEQAEDHTDPASVDTHVDMDVTSKAPAVDTQPQLRFLGRRGLSVIHLLATADKLYDVLGQFCKSSDNRFNSLVRVIEYESSIGGARKELPKVLDGIPELTED
ncbi:hypothetical protein ACS0TY_001337 [Phlomoides rotata]